MSRHRQEDSQQTIFSFDAKVTPRGDGSFIITPGRPIIGRVKLTVAEAAKKSGLSEDTIMRLYQAELIEGEQPTPRTTKLYEDSLDAHIRATRDREFWENKNRRQLYLDKI